MVAIAVPVRGGDGEFLAAIAIHAPTVRHSQQSLRAMLQRLRDAAAAIAVTLDDAL